MEPRTGAVSARNGMMFSRTFRSSKFSIIPNSFFSPQSRAHVESSSNPANIRSSCYTASGCSDDAGIATAQNSKDTYCAQASIYTSTTSSAISRDVPATTTATIATGTGATSAQTTANNGDVRVESTSSGSATGASATETGNAASKDLVVGAGSLMMGLAGLVGAFL